MNAPESFFQAAAGVSSESQLARIVRSNEEIKSIVATAFKINLMALNAIFLAKRAGTAALGFGVLSNELRRFAQDLTQQMALLREMTAESVTAVSSLMQQRRLDRILDLAVRACEGKEIAGLDVVMARAEAAFGEKFQRLRQFDKVLHRALESTGQLVELGGVLARSAKIEAAYGGQYSSSLMQVSTDFAEVIDQIKLSLEKLTRERLINEGS